MTLQRELSVREILERCQGPEANEVALHQCARNVKANFLIIGHLLLDNQQNAYWSMNKKESWDILLDEVGISPPTASRLMNIARMHNDGIYTEEQLLEMHPSSLYELIPVWKRGGLNDELKEFATSQPVQVLRQRLGKKSTLDTDSFILCPRCGAEIHGVKWTGKER